MLCGCPRDIPNLLEPLFEVFLIDSTFFPLRLGWFPVSTWFSLHQDEFHIIFYDGIRLVGFTEKF